MKALRILAVLLVLPFLSSSLSMAQSSTSEAELTKQIEAIKERQAALLKELEEIKRLLPKRPAAPAPDALPKDPINISNEPFKGHRRARIAVIEFSDYQCRFCSRYLRDTFPQLETDYIKTGKVKYVFRDLPLDIHKQAFKAAEATHCAGEQGKFWEMHDLLFQNPTALTSEDLPKYARTLELAEQDFQQCVDSSRYAADIRKDITEAESAGIRRTPSFLIGTIQNDGRVRVVKKLVGAKTYAEFKAAVDRVLACTPASPFGMPLVATLRGDSGASF